MDSRAIVSVSRFRAPKSEVSDDVLLSLALELEREQEETLQRFLKAVEQAKDLTTVKRLVKEYRECGVAYNS